MESAIAKESERALVEATQRLSPEERVNAFLTHCRLVLELHEAGRHRGTAADLKDAARAIAADPATLDLGLLRRLARQFGREAADSLELLLSG